MLFQNSRRLRAPALALVFAICFEFCFEGVNATCARTTEEGCNDDWCTSIGNDCLTMGWEQKSCSRGSPKNQGKCGILDKYTCCEDASGLVVLLILLFGVACSICGCIACCYCTKTCCFAEPPAQVTPAPVGAVQVAPQPHPAAFPQQPPPAYPQQPAPTGYPQPMQPMQPMQSNTVNVGQPQQPPTPMSQPGQPQLPAGWAAHPNPGTDPNTPAHIYPYYYSNGAQTQWHPPADGMAKF